MEELHRRGVDLGWLLTGSGAMFREGVPATPAGEGDAAEAVREELGVQVEQWRHVAEEREKRIAALEREVEHLRGLTTSMLRMVEAQGVAERPPAPPPATPPPLPRGKGRPRSTGSGQGRLPDGEA